LAINKMAKRMRMGGEVIKQLQRVLAGMATHPNIEPPSFLVGRITARANQLQRPDPQAWN